MKTRVLRAVALSLLAICLFTASFAFDKRPAVPVTLPAPCMRGVFANSRDSIPPNWPGPIFGLSQQYPEVPPPSEAYPWKDIDFKTNPEAILSGAPKETIAGVNRTGTTEEQFYRDELRELTNRRRRRAPRP